MAKKLYGLSLADILPSSILGDPQVLAMIAALDPELTGVSDDIKQALIYSRIDELPEPVLDLLAWQFHADFYEPITMNIQAKRNIVKSAIMVHRKMGTPWAVRRLFTDLGFQVLYEEWFTFGGEPGVDRLNVWIGDSFDFSPASRELIRRAWNTTKSTRTHLESLALALWYEDELGDIEDNLLLQTYLSFFDLYPWLGLRYGNFDYGTGRLYGEDSPDILSIITARPLGLEDVYKVPSLYGEIVYGEFAYGAKHGVQDGGLWNLKLSLGCEDDYGDIEESGEVRACFAFSDFYPWLNLRYGHFDYGSNRYYGEDTPDYLDVVMVKPAGTEDDYKVPMFYGEVVYGGFVYGDVRGIQEGGEITVSRPLVYGNFVYGDENKYGGERLAEVI